MGARTTGIRPRGDLDPVSLLRFANWLRRLAPDALVLTSWKRVATAAAAARLARVPMVVQRIGSTHPVPPGLRRTALRRGVDAVWVNSRDLREHMLRSVPGLEPDRVVVIPNGVVAVDVAPAALRSELGLSSQARLVLGAGGLEPRKGFDVLLAAVAMLPEDVHVAIAGGGRERGALEAMASQNGIVERVHLLGHRNDVSALMRAADAFALPSRNESMPVVVLEAMAAGVPIVATEVSGTREQLDAREDRPAAGWVVPIGDAAALAEAVMAALERGGDGGRRGEEAKRRVQEEFTPERLAGAVEALLSGGRAGSRMERP
jgi:glycosyltransferase involved in cell wall biosynthesis